MPRHERSHDGFHVSSSSFEKDASRKDVNTGDNIIGRFKRQCTGDGSTSHKDLSPSLEWHNAPEGTETFAITMVDIDAPDPDAPIAPFSHWVVYNIPASTTSLPEGFSGGGKGTGNRREDKGHEELQEGENDFKVPHYTGPNPPSGLHRYVIKVYALDSTLKLGHNARREKLEAAIDGHILAQAQLEAVYSREKQFHSTFVSQ